MPFDINVDLFFSLSNLSSKTIQRRPLFPWARYFTLIAQYWQVQVDDASVIVIFIKDTSTIELKRISISEEFSNSMWGFQATSVTHITSDEREKLLSFEHRLLS